jgi:uncharacterized protein YecT (DUF1311 family)
MRRLLHLASAIGCICLSLVEPAFAEKRVALVIGNSVYVNVPRLANPRHDATAVADTLTALGFSLVGGSVQLDLDKPGFDAAVQSFGNQLLGADVGLFYYAGHGVQVRGTNYLVPVGANPTKEADVDFQMLDVNLVLRQMESAGAKLKIVILDACRNNPFGGRGLRSTSTGLAQMRAPEGTLISFATQPGNVALDGADGNSPYTKALTQAMRKPGLDVFRTFNEVGLAVASATGGAQQPWISLSPIKGDFYFTNAPEAAPETKRSPESGESQVAAIQPAAPSTPSLPPFTRRTSEDPGVNCSGAGLEPIEQMMCADADLARANGELQRAFDLKRRKLRGTARTALIAGEREWIKQRDRNCGIPIIGAWTEIDLRTIKACVIAMSRARVDELTR